MVLLEIVTSLVMGGLVAKLKISGGSDAQKIEKICTNCGLTKENKSIQIYRRTNFEWGTEYAYRIPYGLGFSDFEKKLDQIQDGLNAKKTVMDIRWEDIKNINLRGNIAEQIKTIVQKKMDLRKEVELSFDGMLKVKVYNQPLPELFHYDESLLKSCKGWKIPVGVTRSKTIYHDFEQIPHMIVAGTTRYGKTVFLKNIITTLIDTQSRNVKFTLLDLKGGLAFQRFKNLSQVKCVAKNVNESLNVLKALHAEVEKRMETFLDQGFEDVKEAKFKERHFIIIDEAAELAPQGIVNPDEKKNRAQCQHYAAEIARIGAGIGYRLIFATQYPTADCLPRQIKQNCDSQVCFRLKTETASRVVLDESGAEKLPLIKGRAIYSTDKNIVLQSPLIENDFIHKVITPHIVLKPRKEEFNDDRERSEDRTNTVVFEEA